MGLITSRTQEESISSCTEEGQGRMDLSSTVQWWDEWQLRILVLGSLGVQHLLAIFAGGRKFNIPPWYKFLIWLSYLGSDALIFVTAYNIEDNELWRRHIIIALSQVIVAVYVFSKSWSPSADKRLYHAAFGLFASGIMKCVEKPWALKSASFNSLVSSSNPITKTTTTNREEELEVFVQEARALIQRNDPPSTLGDDRASHLRKLTTPDKLFKDFAYPYHVRLANLELFWVLNDTTACQSLELGLSEIFDRLYNKKKMFDENDNDNSRQDCAMNTWAFSVILPIAAIGLFHSSHKGAYSSSHVIVTLLSLYGCFAHGKRNSRLMSFAGYIGCKELLHQYWASSKPCYSSEDISMLVRGYVKHWWTMQIEDAESYMKFTDNRGQWTLEREICDQRLGWSLEKPFDESILLWHAATDFCLHLKGSDHEFSGRCRDVSNYMMHLLFDNPEMLMAGSRRNMFTTAYSELEDILQGEDLRLMDEEKLSEKIIEKVKCKEGFIHDAWLIAEGLMGLDDEKMWEVIKDVWVEMLCFSAARSRGYLHAKCMGSGGEYLSYVWLLLAHAGMETFPERRQRVQLKLPKERRVCIVKERIEEAARKKTAAGPSSQVEVVVSQE